MDTQELLKRLNRAIDARQGLLDSRHESALRLFNGFTEGMPGLVVDLYGQTLVLFNYAEPPSTLDLLLSAVRVALLARLPWVQAVLVKTRGSKDPDERRGKIVYGSLVDHQILENGIWYAIDLQMNQDASFYLDTRGLRAWLKEKMLGRTVLNTFAYTGSLGAAAAAGGARRVVQTDLSAKFLGLSKKTFRLNDLPVQQQDFIAADFFRQAGNFKRAGELFDCVILDPPFFSTTAAGKVDLVAESSRLINKVRPLVAHDGWLVAINNALFVSGAAYLASLEALCADGYMALEQLIPVPEDMTGMQATRAEDYPADPSPFNHPTKIAILRIRRKNLQAQA